MKVFISHSTGDMGLVHELYNSLEHVGLKPYVAEYYPEPGEELPQKIKRNIDDSQFVVALLTHNGSRSQAVDYELGYADKAGKKIIQVVEKGVEPNIFLKSKEHIPFNRANPYETERVIELTSQVLQHLKTEKEKAALVLLGIIGFFLFMLRR